jgi:hypothetical protein
MEYLSFIAIVISALSLLLSYFNQKAAQGRWEREQAQAQDKRYNEICSDIAVLKKQVELFWSSIEGNIGTLLKSPHTPDKDLLVYKFQHQELTLEEAELLRSMWDDDRETMGRNNGILGLLLPIAVFDARIYKLRWDKEHPKCIS